MNERPSKITGVCEMADRIRGFSWAKTILGPISNWDNNLLVHVNMMLACPFPMMIWWGHERIQLYNEGCKRLLATKYKNKHPQALGLPAQECWHEAWESIAKNLAILEHDPHGVFEEDTLISTNKNNEIDDLYWTFSFSGLEDAFGKIEGTLIVFKETTAAIRQLRHSKQQSAFVLKLIDSVRGLKTKKEIEIHVAECILNYMNLQRIGFVEVDSTISSVIKSTEFSANVHYPMDGTDPSEDFSELFLSAINSPTEDRFQYTWSYQNGSLFIVPIYKEADNSYFLYGCTKSGKGWDRSEMTLLAQIADRIGEIVSVITAQQELILSEKRYRVIFDSIGDAFMVLDFMYDENGQPINYKFVKTNPAFEIQSGLKDVVGKTILEIMPDVEKVWIETYGAVSIHRKTIQFEQYNEGTKGFYEVFASPVNEYPSQVVVVFRDITEKKKETEMKDKFLSMASHELKTPLTSLYSYLQIARRLNEAEKHDRVMQMLEKSENQLVKMTSVINGFLQLSHLEDSSPIFNPVTFDIAQLTETLYKEAQLQYPNHVFDLHITAPALIIGDKDKLLYAIQQIISNAAKYSPLQTLIDISCICDEKQVKISVRDKGIGIEENAKKNIFKKFYRINDNPYTGISGFGLGLYISYEILKLHGSEIMVNSMPDQGSTFYFTLPLITHQLKNA